MNLQYQNGILIIQILFKHNQSRICQMPYAKLQMNKILIKLIKQQIQWKIISKNLKINKNKFLKTIKKKLILYQQNIIKIILKQVENNAAHLKSK